MKRICTLKLTFAEARALDYLAGASIDDVEEMADSEEEQDTITRAYQKLQHAAYGPGSPPASPCPPAASE